MTRDEFAALAQLLQRTPMTGAEIIWINQFLGSCELEIIKAENEQRNPSRTSTPSPANGGEPLQT